MDEISLIKQRLDIKDIIGGYIDLKKVGRNYQALCPFHNEKTPSFSVSQDLQNFKCFGCGESGDMFSFIQKVEGIDFRQTLEKLAERANVELKEYKPSPQAQKNKELKKINQISSKFYNYLLLNHTSGKKALEYLKKDRGFKPKTIKEFELGYAPDTWDTLLTFLKKKKIDEKDLLDAGVTIKKRSGTGYIDKFRKRVLFPLVDVSGSVVGFSGRALEKEQKPKYLNTAETKIFHKSDFIYGLYQAKIDIKHDGAVVVEGQTDVISAWQAGIKNVVAPLGTALTHGQLRLLARYSKDITFCFDSDNAGITAALRAISLAEKLDFNIKVAQIPEKYSDLDEFIRSDVRKVKEMLKESVPVYDFFISSALKRHDIKKPYGKKAAMEDLVKRFSVIHSDVLLDHYVKKIAKVFDLEVETVLNLITKKRSVDSFEVLEEPKQNENTGVEELLISLLLQANIDITRDFVYKIDIEDFFDETLKKIFSGFKNYVEQHAENFEISEFINSLEVPLKKACSDIFLKNYKVPLDDKKALIAELEKLLNRIKKQGAKREISALSKDLKVAEQKKDLEQIQIITLQLQELSKYLL